MAAPVSLRERYEQAIAASDGRLSSDPGQLQVIDELQRILDQLDASAIPASTGGGWFRRLFRASASVSTAPDGLYLWGGVGRGKTFLMELFIQALSAERVQRYHYHRFMRMVHERLKKYRDQQSPLESIAAEIVTEAQVLCLDEFFVEDITDAMLLGGLLSGLFTRGAVLVTTSNVDPVDLYRDGLQSDRFLPAIERLRKHTVVMKMPGSTDYRLRSLEKEELYFTPSGEAADEKMARIFEQINARRGHEAAMVDIAGRPISTRELGDGVVWFEFDALCDGPRSATDYIEISRLYHTVLISNVPVLDTTQNDPARRFIGLVDEFYDRAVKLILSAQVAIDDLYQGTRLRFEFRRTRSRLQQMQTVDYLSREHRP